MAQKIWKKRILFLMMALFLGTMSAIGIFFLANKGERAVTALGYDEYIDWIDNSSVYIGKILDADGEELWTKDFPGYEDTYNIVGELKTNYMAENTVTVAYSDVLLGMDTYNLIGGEDSLSDAGQDINLTIRHKLSESVYNYMKENGVKSGSALFAEADTGKILAAVSLPGASPCTALDELEDGALLNKNLSTDGITVDYQIPELEYGSFSTTQTGLMEKALLPGLQQSVYSTEGGTGYGITTGDGIYVAAPEIQDSTPTIVYQQPAYTSVDGMERSDGSIGTLKIPSLGINMKVWEGETNASMSKGRGHYSSTSAWDGNVAMCGHTRGSKYVIGDIKDMEKGDLITYTTVYGTRTYAVVSVEIIASNDWSSLQATSDNRITLTTCLANHPEKRVCVQAVQING